MYGITMHRAAAHHNTLVRCVDYGDLPSIATKGEGWVDIQSGHVALHDFDPAGYASHSSRSLCLLPGAYQQKSGVELSTRTAARPRTQDVDGKGVALGPG